MASMFTITIGRGGSTAVVNVVANDEDTARHQALEMGDSPKFVWQREPDPHQFTEIISVSSTTLNNA